MKGLKGVWCSMFGHRRKFSTYPRGSCIRCGSLPPPPSKPFAPGKPGQAQEKDREQT